MNGKVTYRQQVSYCGKPQCRKCREGVGHGPYWYAYRTEDGHTTRTYIGKHLPADAHITDTPGASTDAVGPAKLQIGRSYQTPLVGRASELEAIRQLLFTSEAGNKVRLTAQKKVSAIPLDTQRSSQCMVLMGEAGIGKTRLAEEVSREAQERGWAVVWSRVYAQESNIPYRLWIEILRNVINAGLGQKQEISKHPLVYARLAALLPELYDQLSQTVSPLTRSSGQEQQGLWEAVLELLMTASKRAPILIVLDDIQWADTSSCELLAYLARRVSTLSSSFGSPIMFLATCRETDLSPKHPLRSLFAHMQREHTVMTLSIQPLTDAQISSLLAYSHLPITMIQDIQRQAAGNPFFAEELAYSLSTEAPTTSGSKHQTTRKRRSSLPGSITAALDHRMSKLSHSCQQLLSNAAVLGGSFEFSLIRSMETNSSTPVDEDRVLDLLDEALQAGVLTEEGRGTRISYSFWQPLLVSHLYNGLSATKRALLHRRAADILQQMYATREAEGAATITHHLVEGGAEPQQIARYARLAGDSAYALSAYPEAERYYRLAIEHVGTTPMIAQSEPLHLAYLLEQLGECTRIQGNYEGARHIYERALNERSHQRKLASLAPAEAQREAQVDALLWSEVGWTWYYSGDYAHTRQYCERGEQVLRKAEVVAGPAWARLYFQQSYVLWQEGNYDAARRAAYEALKLFEEHLRDREYHGGNTRPLTRLRCTLAGDPVDLARTHRLLGSLANSVGQSTEALTHFNTALTLLEQHDHQREVAHVCCNVGHIHLQKAEHELARSFLQRSLSLAERIGDVPLISVVFSNLGELAARSDNLTEAEILFKRALTIAEQTNDHVYMSMWNVELASVYQDQGKLAEAGACIRRALAIGRAIHNAPCTGLALVALAKMRIAQAMEADKARAVGEERAATRAEGPEEPGIQPHTARAPTRDAYTRYLMRARMTLQRALAFDKLEAEVRNKGQLASAQVSLSLGDAETAQIQALHALKKARQYELTWLVAHAQRLLGSILAAQGLRKEADEHFEQAIHVFRKCGMRLEYARTLQSYGNVLLQRTDVDHQQGLGYLQEALQIFSKCGAVLDVQMVEHILSTQR